MSDLIERQAAIDALANYIHNVDKVCGMSKLLSADDCKDAAKRVLDDLPSIQPTYTEAQLQKMQDIEQTQLDKAFELGKEEIIRCKDCKYLTRWRSEESARKFGQAYECIHGVLASIKEDDYCSHAKRRTDD